MRRLLFILLLSGLASGCGTSGDVTSNVWFGTGIEISRTTGRPHIVSHTSSYSMTKVNEVAKEYCEKHGFSGLRGVTLKSQTHTYNLFDFECIEPTAQPVVEKSSEVERLRAEAEASRQRQRQLEEQLNQARQQPPPTQPVAQPNTDRLSLDASKVKCTDLGFKPGTEAHGKCVLQLSK